MFRIFDSFFCLGRIKANITENVSLSLDYVTGDHNTGVQKAHWKAMAMKSQSSTRIWGESVPCCWFWGASFIPVSSQVYSYVILWRFGFSCKVYNVFDSVCSNFRVSSLLIRLLFANIHVSTVSATCLVAGISFIYLFIVIYFYEYCLFIDFQRKDDSNWIA